MVSLKTGFVPQKKTADRGLGSAVFKGRGGGKLKEPLQFLHREMCSSIVTDLEGLISDVDDDVLTQS